MEETTANKTLFLLQTGNNLYKNTINIRNMFDNLQKCLITYDDMFDNLINDFRKEIFKVNNILYDEDNTKKFGIADDIMSEYFFNETADTDSCLRELLVEIDIIKSDTTE